MFGVCGPIRRKLADLGVAHGGVGAAPQEMIDHVPAAVEGRVVERGAREIKAGRNEVDRGAMGEELVDCFDMPPCRRVDKGI